jgi:hypothetical protein
MATRTQVDKRGGGRFKEGWCETMENESIGCRRMGINYKGSQGQTERAVTL